jgi:hypothetical protein
MLSFLLIFLRQLGDRERKNEHVVVVGLLLLKKHKGECKAAIIREQKQTCVCQRKINKIYHACARCAGENRFPQSKCESGVRFGWVRENVNVNDVGTNESSGRAATASSWRRRK